MRYIFVFDPGRCIGCGACAVACMDQNDIDPEKNEILYRQCFTMENVNRREDPVGFASIACMHCENAPCIQGCPTGCLRKDSETNLTIYDNTNCIGCHSCAMACPFSAPGFGEDGKMVKCDGCVIRVKNGMLPACVKVCPFGALKLLKEEEFNKIERKKAASLVIWSVLKNQG